VPLIQGKSDKSREKNIKTEVAFGKPPKQAVAIAYATQRKAKKQHDWSKAKA
jgi:hypothetical protein